MLVTTSKFIQYRPLSSDLPFVFAILLLSLVLLILMVLGLLLLTLLVIFVDSLGLQPAGHPCLAR